MVVDALRMERIAGEIGGVRAVRGYEDVSLVGFATTVQYAPVGQGVAVGMYRAIADAPPRDVLVVDGGGLACNFVGDNIGEFAKRQGYSGIVVYGGIRDLAGLRALDIPVFATTTSVTPRSDGIEVTGYDVPLQLGDAVVRAGDIVVADEDGVVVIPLDVISQLEANLEVVRQVEAELERAIAEGAPPTVIGSLLARKRAKHTT